MGIQIDIRKHFKKIAIAAGTRLNSIVFVKKTIANFQSSPRVQNVRAET